MNKKIAVGKAKVEKKNGRPTLYHDGLIDLLNEFFSPQLEAFSLSSTDSGLKMLPQRPPTIERFAVMNGVSYRTIKEWAADKNEDGSLKKPLFAEAYERAKCMQAALLFEGGVMKIYDSNMSRFALETNHDWKVVHSTEITHSFDESVLNNAYSAGMAELKKREAISAKEKADILIDLTDD